MNQNTRTSLGFLAFLSFAAVAPAILAAQQASSDPFIWLEDVNGQKSMDWVNAHNASTVAELTASPVYQSIYNRTKAILDSKDRIAYPSIIGDKLYNSGRTPITSAGSGGGRAGAITRPAIRNGRRCSMSMRWRKPRG